MNYNYNYLFKRKGEIHLRVYIAIDFEDGIKNYLDKITSYIKNHCIEGSFTRKNNFHLTVRFIGEVDNIQIAKIKEVIDKAVLNISPFELLVDNLGVFKRKNTNILWIGIEKNAFLSELYEKLSTLLKESNIPFYDKLYMPHITLCRRVLFGEGQARPSKSTTPYKFKIFSNNVVFYHIKYKNTYIHEFDSFSIYYSSV